ncbi:MAG TPA: glycosyltransferase family 39 protein, partial [Chloroflexia bacterium]|nr:glycosyltransferase family 39 protein [Chloroflexia bacterium]
MTPEEEIARLRAENLALKQRLAEAREQLARSVSAPPSDANAPAQPPGAEPLVSAPIGHSTTEPVPHIKPLAGLPVRRADSAERDNGQGAHHPGTVVIGPDPAEHIERDVQAVPDGATRGIEAWVPEARRPVEARPAERAKPVEKRAPRDMVRGAWKARPVWLGVLAFLVGAAGQVLLFEEPQRALGVVLLVGALVLAMVAWSGLRDAPLLTATPEPARRLLNMRPELALRLVGIAVSLGLLVGSYMAWYRQPDDIFGWQGVLWLASMAVLLISCAQWYPGGKGQDPLEAPWPRWEYAVLAALVVVSLVTHLTWLDRYPYEIDVNEYFAWYESMAFYRDPPTVSMFTTVWLNLGLPSLWFWFQAQFLHLFGVNLVGLRFITGLVGALTIIPVYLLSRLVWGRTAALLSAVPVAFLIVILHHSRQSSNNIATGLFWTFCFYFLLKGLRTRRPADFVWAGLWAGTSQYTYYGTRLLPYLLVAFGAYLAIFHFRAFRERLGLLALTAVGFMVGFGPLVAYFTRNPEKWAGRGLSELIIPLEIPTNWDQIANIWNKVWPEVWKNFLSLSVIPANDTFFFAPFLRPFEMVLLALSFGVLIYRWRQPASFLVLLWAGSVAAVSSIINIPINPNPNFTHWAPAWPVFFLAYGLAPALWLAALKRTSRRLWQAGSVLVAAGIIVLAFANFRFYIVDYPGRVLTDPVLRSIQAKYLMQVKPGSVARFVSCCWFAFDTEFGRAFAANTPAGQFLNPSRDLPLVMEPSRDQVFIMPRTVDAYLPVLQHYYPGGQIDKLTGNDGTYVASAYKVPADLITARYGVSATVSFNGNVVATGKVPTVGSLPPGVPTDRYPLQVTWIGAFYVEKAGPATLSLQGATGRVWVMGQQVAP